MLKGLGDIGQIMKLQKELKNVQKKLKKMETEAESSDGSVRATVNGEHMLINLDIDPDILNSPDKEKLEKSIISAVNSAVEKNKDFAANEMSKITGGMNIPGLSNFLE